MWKYGRDQIRSRNTINEISDKYNSKSKQENTNLYSKLNHHQLNSSAPEFTNDEHIGDAARKYGRDQIRSRNTINEISDKYNSKSIQENTNLYSKLNHHQLNSSAPEFTNDEYIGDAARKYGRDQIRSRNNINEISDNSLIQINEDLFKLPDDFSLAHCVAEDLRMGAGIAVEFKRIFGGVGKLLDQKLKVGDVGLVNQHNRTVFYLITKKNSNGKPTMMSLRKALLTLLDKMKELNLTKLGIPQIGCGLDNLNWSEVSLLIKQIFSGSKIHITVCKPSKIESKKSWPLKVYVTSINLWDMMTETVFIIFIDVRDIHQNNLINNVVEEINKKYPFKENLLKDIKNKKLNPGDITEYSVNNKVIFCVFTNQNKYFTSIEEAFLKINHRKKFEFMYSAIQSGPMEDCIKQIVLTYRSTVNNSELWLCGHPGQGEQLKYEQYCSSMRRFSFNFLDITS